MSYSGFRASASLMRRNKVRDRARVQKQAEHNQTRLSLLQGQLEPHFLFNALNSVSALVREGDRNTALNALTQLSNLLRFSLRARNKDWNSVQDELEFVKDYLQLQIHRFGSALSVQWEMSGSDWSTVASPPLLFQPLVENAIRHGVEAGDSLGEISISLGRTLTHVVFRIENSMPIVPLVHGGHGIGLATTRERLSMLYGDQATLQCGVSEQRYAVTLSYPLRDWNSSVARTHR